MKHSERLGKIAKFFKEASGWKKTSDGSYDHNNKVSYVTVDPDMDSDGGVFWVVHIRSKSDSYVDKFDTKGKAMNFAKTYMSSHPQG